MLIDKDLFGWLSVAFSIISLAPYYYFIFKNKIKPHAFSWFIWSILTTIGFFAQYSEGAGPGAWATGATTIGCSGITIIALFKGEKNITKSDWISFIAAISAIPLWYFTNDPLWSVILISIIDVIGYFPTIRKSFHKPYEELAFTPIMGTIKYIFSLFAMEKWSVTTLLYPAAISAANILLVIVLIIQRRKTKN